MVSKVTPYLRASGKQIELIYLLAASIYPVARWLAFPPALYAARRGVVLMIRTCDARPRTRHGRPALHRLSRWPLHRLARWLARWRPHITADTWRRLFREIWLVAAFAVIYEEIGQHMVQAGAAAASHALLVVSAEQTLGLFREHALQAAIIGNDTVTDTFNAYYGGTHFLIPAAVLAWLMFRHPAHYGRARTALAVITGLGFVCFWLFPVAPPRLLPARFGIVDTLVAPDGSGHFDSTLISTAGDRYASMPSLHVAWAVWAALALYPVLRHWALRTLAVAYPLMTTLVVVATGNHYFLDVIAGTLLACVTWVAVTRIGAWLAVQTATSGPHPAGPAGLGPRGRSAGG
jgi:membrane-associated phospholipid phosphatase